jgi:demethylmenaquinone methyltransferase/2-methoxy-6-polyprenyl-1,4-benzoquinol methylase
MDMETFAKSSMGKLFIRGLGAGMESRIRYRFFSPQKILEGVEFLSGKVVLEVGCGTGFFTIPAARLISDQGRLVALDRMPEAVEFVSQKVQAAGLKNVCVVKGDAQDTGLDAESFDIVLLFGEIPAPMLSLSRLLPEIHRLLRPQGILAVWPPVPGWLPQSILQSGLFILSNKRNGVHNFRRCMENTDLKPSCRLARQGKS